MLINTNDNYQEQLIGMCLSNPSLLVNEFNIDALDSPYDRIYKTLKDEYERHRFIDESVILKLDKMYVTDIYEWRRSVTSSDIKDYERIKTVAYEKWQTEQVQIYARQLEQHQIDLTRFYFAMDMLRENKSPNLRHVTSADFDNFLEKADTMIQFKRFPKLNNQKIAKGDFVILAGGTGSGKTALALNLALDLAETYPIVYINIELSEDVIYKRMIATYTNTAMSVIDDRANLPANRIERMKGINPFVDSHEFHLATGSQTVESIRQIVGSFPQDKHFIVFIDHIGRISGNGESYERMTQTAIALRNMALDFNCTMFGLCQVNRDAHNHTSPKNSMLRDSGEVEQSARKVMFIWNKEKGENLGLYMWFTKNDSGELGQIRIVYDKETQHISEVNDNGRVQR